MGVHHVTSNVPITYYFPSVHNMYMCQGLSSDCSNIVFLGLDPIHKCISGQLEELAGEVKLELCTDQLCIKVEGI